MQKVDIRQAQELMTTILRDVDKLCKENNIPYWIDAGTLLGAVRHGGFIPWDDDIDICMLREDYKVFLEVAKEKLPEDLFLQNVFVEKGVNYGWSKIKHKHSRLIEADQGGCHEGMYIDVFPCDYYESKENDELINLKKKYWKKRAIIGYNDFEFEKLSKNNIVKNIKIAGCKLYNKFIFKKELSDIYEEMMIVASEFPVRKDATLIGYGLDVLNFSEYFEKDSIFPLREIEFEGLKVLAPNNLDKYLRGLYGDSYMELPPEKDRQIHNLGLFIGKNRK